MNLTISVDEETLRRARDRARARGTSLQDLVRGYLSGLVGSQPAAAIADELVKLMRDQGGHSGGAQFRRADVYKERT